MSDTVLDRARNEAMLLHRQGRLEDARWRYENILSRAPGDAETLHLLGLIHHQQGRHDQAATLLRQALSAQPESPVFWNNLAKVLHHARRFDEAVAAHRQALRINPDQPEFLYDLGLTCRAQGSLIEARGCFEQVLRLRPHHAPAASELGTLLRLQGHFDQSRALLETAVRVRPDYLNAWANLGLTLQDQGLDERARACFQRASQLAPNNPELHFRLAEASFRLGLAREAQASYGRALQLQPDYPEALVGLGNLLRELRRLDEALSCHQRALALRPDLAEAHANAAVVHLSQGLLDEAIAGFKKALSLKPDSAPIHSNLLYTMLLHPGFDAATLLAAHQEWNRRHAAPIAPLPPPRDRNRDPHRRLRIGYVSPDFHEHSVSRFLLPLLANHDHRLFEIFCYSNTRWPDAVTSALRAMADHWMNIGEIRDEQAAAQIRQDGIDILVDLTGHMAGNRLLIFARKPAPVQATYLGYPNTTGLSMMDYRLTDGVADPPGAEKDCSEKLIRLPRTNWVFHPPEKCPECRHELDSKEIVFGSFNNFSKVTVSMLGLWARILKAVPNSRLLLQAAGLGSASVQSRVRNHFAVERIFQDRLELRGFEASYAEHMALYNRIDVALDTFPYHGTTTTCEALWMAVPVVSLAGQTHASRVGVSLLNNMGLPSLVAHTPEQYVQLAVALAQDPPRLADLRQTLRQRMARSPLMDAPQFARDMEAAYRTMWQQWCAAPAPFTPAP